MDFLASLLTIDYLISNLIGVVIGLVSSWIFWKYQLNIKPKLQVSNFAIYESHSQTFKIKVKNDGYRDITDISANFRISQRKKGQKSGDYFVQKLVDLSEHAAYRQVLGPINDNQAWGLLNSCIFESDPNDQALDFLGDEIADSEIERRLVVDISCIDAQSGSKLVNRQTYSINQIEIDKQFTSGLTIHE